MLTLSLNGDAITIDPTSTLSLLLDQQGYQAQKIAVAINGEFVPRSQYSDITINEGDQVDVIQAVGGG